MVKNLVVCAFFALLCAVVSASVDDLKCDAGDRHPIVFFPGVFGSRIEEKFDISSSVPMPHASCPRKSKDWESGWVEWKKILPLANFDCLVERFSMHPNEAGDKWTDTPGTEFRVPNWGTVASVDPLSSELGKVIRMYGRTMDILKGIGYEDGKTLLVASYDWRKMPTPQWKEDVRQLIENAVNSTGKKAVIFSHSMGCPVSYIFLMSQSAEWRQKFIQHYLPVSPVWSGTNIIPFTMVTNRILNITIQPLSPLGALFRYLEGLYVLSPSLVYLPDTLVATTDQYVYTAKNLSMLLERVGVKNAEALTRNVQQQLYQYNYEHPGIPVTTIWSVGDNTLGPFHWNKDSQVGINEPLPEFIEGDGLVPHDSLTYAYKIWSSGDHADITEGVAIPNTNHANCPHDDKTIYNVFKAACDQQ